MSDGQEQSCPEGPGMTPLLASHMTQGRYGGMNHEWGSASLVTRRRVGRVEMGSTSAREQGRAPRRSPKRRGHLRPPRVGQGQGQHSLVLCPWEPPVGCAQLVYLRHSSFEEHGLRPHQHAKVPPRAVGWGCHRVPETHLTPAASRRSYYYLNDSSGINTIIIH